MVAKPPKDTESPLSSGMTRRLAIKRSAVGFVALTGSLTACASGPKVPGTTPKMEAQYQDHANGLVHCSICKHFISPNACEVVAGPVQGQGWCRFYALF